MSQKLSEYGQVVEDPLAHFKAIPWCEAIISDPAVLMMQIPPRQPNATREFSLVNETLNTADTVRGCIVVARKTVPTPSSITNGETTARPFLEMVGLLDLGEGINGYPGTVHGGFFNVMLDEIMGSTVNAYKGDDRLAFTAYLNMTFKKPLHTPQVVVVRGQIRKVEGRKLFVKGSCEDKDGATFAEADGMWVTVELPQAAQKRKASTSGQIKL